MLHDRRRISSHHAHQKDSSHDPACNEMCNEISITNRADRRVMRRFVASEAPNSGVPPAGFEPATPGLGVLPDASTGASMSDYDPILDDSSLRQDHCSPPFRSTNRSTNGEARTSPGVSMVSLAGDRSDRRQPFVDASDVNEATAVAAGE